MIGKIVKKMKWVMRMNESAEIKGKCHHGKKIGPKMSKDSVTNTNTHVKDNSSMPQYS